MHGYEFFHDEVGECLELFYTFITTLLDTTRSCGYCGANGDGRGSGLCGGRSYGGIHDRGNSGYGGQVRYLTTYYFTGFVSHGGGKGCGYVYQVECLMKFLNDIEF
jgi:hypothetical protein